MKLLMIANSFGVNLQAFVHQIAEANKLDLDIYVLYIGGCSLETHDYNITNNLKNYELFHNGETTNEFVSINEMLDKYCWDVVTLQQASHMCGIKETYYPYFEEVYNYVKERCPTSKIMFHKTWAYSSINSYKYETVPSFYPDFKFKDANEMKKGLDEAVNQISNEFKLNGIIASGDVIWQAMKEIVDCYDVQGFHMNPLGSYLIGLNLIKVLFKKPIENVYVPDNMGRKTCKNCIDFINNNIF